MRVLLVLFLFVWHLSANGQRKLIKLQGQFLRISFIDTAIKGSRDAGLYFVPTQSKTFDVALLLKAESIYYLDLGLPLEGGMDSLRYKKSQSASLKTVHPHGETFYDLVKIQMAKGIVEVIETKGSIVSKYFSPGDRDFRLVFGSQEFYVRPKTILDIVRIR